MHLQECCRLRKAPKLFISPTVLPNSEAPYELGSFFSIWYDAGRDQGQEEKGTTEDEMAGRHHQLDRHEFE